VSHIAFDLRLIANLSGWQRSSADHCGLRGKHMWKSMAM